MSGTGTTEAPAAVFVYGTLLPGHLRWHLVDPFVAASHPARAAGRLYDTGRRYPAARFTPGNGEPPSAPRGVVHGAVLRLRPERVGAALEVLDLVEGVEYERIQIEAAHDAPPGTTPCWTYEWIAGPARLVALPDGRWTGD